MVWFDGGRREGDPNSVPRFLWHRHVVDGNYEVSVWPGSRCLSGERGRRKSRRGDAAPPPTHKLGRGQDPLQFDGSSNYEIMMYEGYFYLAPVHSAA